MTTTVAEYYDQKVMIGLFRHEPSDPGPRTWRLVHSAGDVWQQEFNATAETEALEAFERAVADHLGGQR